MWIYYINDGFVVVYTNMRTLTILLITAIVITITVVVTMNNEANAYMCPLDEIEKYAQDISNNLAMWNTFGAQSEVQELLQLIHNAKLDKQAEEQQDLRHYQ